VSRHTGKIVELLDEDRELALVDVLGVRRRDWILDCYKKIVRPVAIGSLFMSVSTMSKISESDALDQMRMLTELGESDAAMEEVRGYGLEESEEPDLAVKPPG
jgi:hydrogenase expression/formation protein HypC